MEAKKAVLMYMLFCALAMVTLLTLLGGCGRGEGDERVASAAALEPSASTATMPLAPPVVVNGAMLESVQAAFQGCFAAPSRGSFAGANLGATCASLPVDPGYLHQGRNRAQEFDAMLADDTMDGATFSVPTILWQQTPARVLARFPLLKTNGFAGSYVTVAQKTGETWTLVGNGRDFNTFVNAFANRRIPLRAGQVARLETGVALHVRNFPARFPRDADIESVTAYGPGLPGYVEASQPGTGLSLARVPGCRVWSISPGSCGKLWRVRIDDLSTGSPIPVESLGPRLQPVTADPYLTDAEITGMPPHSIYKWTITLVPGSPTAVARHATTLTYWDRLRSRPLTSAEIAQVGFLDMTQDTLDLLQNFNGGGKPTLAWTRPGNAAPALVAGVFHGRFVDFQRVGRSDDSATIGCSANPNCNPDGTYRTGMSFVQNGNATFAMFQLMSRTRNGTEIFSQYTR